MTLWRISKFNILDGEGGRLYPGRWNSSGAPIVYLAASAAGAMLEALVHLELNQSTLPPIYTLLQIDTPDDLAIPVLKVPPGDAWKSDFDLTRSLGDRWLAAGESALARVPSAIMPSTFNYLLNPLHAGAPRIRIVATEQARYDARLVSFPQP